jgi:hypothetical protein
MARGSSRVVMTSRIGRRRAMAHAKSSANNLITAGAVATRIAARTFEEVNEDQLVCMWPHRDRSHFGGRSSLSGHNGHGWSGGRPDPDANDPKRTLGG